MLSQSSFQKTDKMMSISLPKLEICINGHALREFPLNQDTITIGRATSNSLVLPDERISRHHAQIVRNPDGFAITDLASKQGTQINNTPLSAHQPRRLSDQDVINIGHFAIRFCASEKQPVSLPLDSPTSEHSDILLGEQTVKADPGRFDMKLAVSIPLDLRGRTCLRLGRDSSNDAVITHPLVSRYHAQIQRQQGSFVITDLDSMNGTFVNGKAVTRPQVLRVGDTVQIGPCRLVLNIDETFDRYDESGNLRLDALNLRKRTQQDAVLLDDISLSILPREFVAVVGVSGAGKSTLLDALNGLRPATSGSVLVNGNDLYKHFNAYRTELGYVPQDDIIHQELTVLQALDYAAQLRLPADTTPAERKQRVQEVLAELELTQRQQVRVKNLSGGQRKRVSMGVELLTKPSLFFLDEATSGLDPGIEAQMMRLLRKLADQGRTILLITHATKNVTTCDLVVFLAKGGRVAYFGPPDQALDYFGVKDFDEIYLKLENERSPQEWQQRYLRSRQYQQYVVQRQQQLPGRPGTSRNTQPVAPPAHVNGISGWRQFWILSRRNLTILLQDRVSLMLMLAVAPLLGIVDFATWRRQNLFDPVIGDANLVQSMIFITVLVCAIVGSLSTMREIVKEADIYRRERRVGLKLVPYIFSKFGIAAILAVYQAVIFLLTKQIAVILPGGVDDAIALYITLLLLTIGGMVMGLLVSALSPNQNVAPLLTILFLIPQITFSGGLLPLKDLGDQGQWFSQLTITRWGFESIVTITGMGRDVAEDDCWQQPKSKREALSETAKKSCQCLGDNLFKHCHFPGVQKHYDAAVDQPEPRQPQKPTAPASHTLDETVLKAYNDNVNAYSQDMDQWQRQYSTWKENRGTAIAAAEALIDRFHEKQGDTFKVNLPRHWSRMGLHIIGVLGLLLLIQRRKDNMT
jgi:ABC-type multidrug transport system ATPase subunit